MIKMSKKEPTQDEAQLQEFNRRIKSYDTLSFLEKANAILSIITSGKRQVDPSTIAEITGVQLRALPLRR